MHHVNYFSVNLGSAHMKQCIPVTDIASSLTRIELQNIRDNKKICAHNYSRTAAYFERVFFVIGRFNICWIQKQVS